MKTIEATYRIVTPMFIGGANQDPSDGIRPPSFKGALRFWWRALNWGKFYQVNAGDESEALKALHQEESRLFGSAAKDGKGGQGCFLLSVSKNVFGHKKQNEVHPDFKNKDAARYLAYGLMEAFSSRKTGKKAGQLVRGCLNENQYFTVSLKFRGEIDGSILSSLKALGLLGGLGSRTRKGLGSIALEKIEDVSDENHHREIWLAPQNVDAYKEEVVQLFCNDLAPHTPFTAISDKGEIAVLLSSTNPFETLNQYGEAMLMYRSWGKGGQVLGKASEKNFKDDHDWSKGMMPKDFHPRRVVFGLPHNYGKQDYLHVEPEKHKRRSSPLFFHVHQLGNEYIGLAILMPAQFLPKGEKIKAGEEKVEANIEWDVLSGFLHGKDKQGKPRFNLKTIVGGQS